MNTGDKFTEYEWIVEPIDKHEDIIDVYHHETFKSALGGSDSLYLDVIEIVTGKLPYGRVEQ